MTQIHTSDSITRQQVGKLTVDISSTDLHRIRADLNREKRELDALRRTDLSATIQRETRRLKEKQRRVSEKSTELVQLENELAEADRCLVAAHFAQQTAKRDLKAKETIVAASRRLASKARQHELKLSESVDELEEQKEDLVGRQDRLRRDQAQVKTERDILRRQLGRKDEEIAALRDDIQLKKSLLRTRQERISRLTSCLNDQASKVDSEGAQLQSAKHESLRLNELDMTKRRTEAELAALEIDLARHDSKTNACVNVHPWRKLCEQSPINVIEVNQHLRTKLASVYDQIADRKERIAELERRLSISR